MEGLRVDRSSVVAAAVLAVLTLFVFLTLRNYGPESAVRRYHVAIEEGNLEALQRYSAGPVNTEGSTQMIQFATNQLRSGAGFQIEQRERRAGLLYVFVSYIRGGRMRVPAFWIVEKSGADGLWRVNADKTYFLLRTAFAR